MTSARAHSTPRRFFATRPPQANITAPTARAHDSDAPQPSATTGVFGTTIRALDDLLQHEHRFIERYNTLVASLHSLPNESLISTRLDLVDSLHRTLASTLRMCRLLARLHSSKEWRRAAAESHQRIEEYRQWLADDVRGSLAAMCNEMRALDQSNFTPIHQARLAAYLHQYDIEVPPPELTESDAGVMRQQIAQVHRRWQQLSAVDLATRARSAADFYRTVVASSFKNATIAIADNANEAVEANDTTWTARDELMLDMPAALAEMLHDALIDQYPSARVETFGNSRQHDAAQLMLPMAAAPQLLRDLDFDDLRAQIYAQMHDAVRLASLPHFHCFIECLTARQSLARQRCYGSFVAMQASPATAQHTVTGFDLHHLSYMLQRVLKGLRPEQSAKALTEKRDLQWRKFAAEYEARAEPVPLPHLLTDAERAALERTPLRPHDQAFLEAQLEERILDDGTRTTIAEHLSLPVLLHAWRRMAHALLGLELRITPTADSTLSSPAYLYRIDVYEQSRLLGSLHVDLFQRPDKIREDAAISLDVAEPPVIVPNGSATENDCTPQVLVIAHFQDAAAVIAADAASSNSLPPPCLAPTDLLRLLRLFGDSLAELLNATTAASSKATTEALTSANEVADAFTAHLLRSSGNVDEMSSQRRGTPELHHLPGLLFEHVGVHSIGQWSAHWRTGAPLDETHARQLHRFFTALSHTRLSRDILGALFDLNIHDTLLMDRHTSESAAAITIPRRDIDIEEPPFGHTVEERDAKNRIEDELMREVARIWHQLHARYSIYHESSRDDTELLPFLNDADLLGGDNSAMKFGRVYSYLLARMFDLTGATSTTASAEAWCEALRCVFAHTRTTAPTNDAQRAHSSVARALATLLGARTDADVARVTPNLAALIETRLPRLLESLHTPFTAEAVELTVHEQPHEATLQDSFAVPADASLTTVLLSYDRPTAATSSRHRSTSGRRASSPRVWHPLTETSPAIAAASASSATAQAQQATPSSMRYVRVQRAADANVRASAATVRPRAHQLQATAASS